MTAVHDSEHFAPQLAAADDLRAHENDAIAQVRAWLEASKAKPSDAAAERLAALLRDEDGLAFSVAFVDEVIRPEDVKVAARSLARIAATPPRFLSWPWRVAVRIGGLLAPVAPAVIVPISRRVLRSMLRHLVIDARPAQLGKAIDRLKSDGQGQVRLNLNLLGEAVLGHEEAGRRLAGTRALIERPDVDYVSIKVSSTVAPHTPWAFDAAVDEAVEALAPLYESAAAQTPPTFINLDMEEYKDLELTLAVFTRLLESHPSLEAGIVLQAYLPDALGGMIRLQEWARMRVADGGAPVKVRVVKGANLPMEQVDAELHGWPLATWESKAHSDASYKAVLNYALTPAHAANIRIGVAGHNLFDMALAWEIATDRGVTDAVDVEMLLGMAPQQAAAVRDTVGRILLYTPIVDPHDFDTAIAYLIRRLEEGASHENFMSAVFDLDDPQLFARERERFAQSLALIPAEVPAARRTARAVPTAPQTEFVGAPDTDPSVLANVRWADGIRSRMEHSTLGLDTAGAGWLAAADAVDAAVATARAAGVEWGAWPPAERARVLRQAALELEARRAELLEIMGHETGKVIEQGDAEVSEAIDFANYYAAHALELDDVDGAAFSPLPVTLVTPPWNFPVAIPAGGVLAALAAGSAAILKPAEAAHRCGAVLAEALLAALAEAGAPEGVLQYVRVDEKELGERLVAHDGVDQVILTGAYETAELFRSFTPSMRLFAETSGKNAIIVTPSADLDLAARDVAYSAFGHAGQKCSASSLVVLVGSVATSERFRRQLVDAAASMPVGMPWEAASRIGPVIEPPRGKLARALTELEPGQEWLLEPRAVDGSDVLFSPGIRTGVQPGSEFHLTEYFGPVMGIMTAATLDEAIAMVNAVDYGLTSGLHSLDTDEIQRWMAAVQAGNLYVNRSITGAIVRRQPFGGWKKSAVGTGTKAGGPSYVASLGTWSDAPVADEGAADELSGEFASLAERCGAGADAVAWLRAAVASDAAAWEQEFGVVSDPSGLECEINAFRYHATPVTVRADAASPVETLRIVAAGLRAGARPALSLTEPLPEPVMAAVRDRGVELVVEGEQSWTERAARMAAAGGRIRLVGVEPAATIDALGGTPAVAVYSAAPVAAGRVEMLPFLREQAVSITAHRFGTPRRYEVPVPTA